MKDATLINGDCLSILRWLDTGSVDAIVTDPPAGIGFMGKEWDDFRRARNEADAGRDNVFGRTSKTGPEYGRNRNGESDRNAYRAVDKDRPGYAFQGGAGVSPDTKNAFVAFLSAVFTEALRVIKPCGYALVWAIPRTSHWTATALENAGWEIRDRIAHIFGQGFPKGKGCLKPAVEDWWLCRAPGKGVKPLGIDECRVPANGDKLNGGRISTTTEGWDRPWKHSEDAKAACKERGQKAVAVAEAFGRWPANICHDGSEEVAALFPETKSGKLNRASITADNKIYGASPRNRVGEYVPNSGSAARFFYAAKASKADRGEGNTHPTVKNTRLMEWLVKLVCDPGGVCLDPFMGSGSTGIACKRLGRKFIGIESNADYLKIARKRLRAA